MSDLIKNAIAEAKAVRATALANAKYALEEAFTEKFKGMFAEKLREETEEEVTDEVSAPNDVVDNIPTKDVSAGQPEVSPTNLEEAEMEEGLNESELDEIISELESEVDSDDSAPAPEEAPAAEPDGDEAPAPEVAPEAEEAPEAKEAPEAEEAPETEDEEEINIDELLKELAEEAEEEEVNLDELEEDIVSESKEGFPTPEGGNEPQCKKVGNKNSEVSLSKDQAGSIENTSAIKEENEKLRAEVKEYENAVTLLEGQLNEINLLNAKLLYTNKLFKEFTLNDDQKMKIVEQFDLTKTVREVKMTYANFAESINFGTNVATKKKVSSNVTTITEGLASKPVASTKPSSKEIISESNSAADRFRKLAGIRSDKKLISEQTTK